MASWWWGGRNAISPAANSAHNHGTAAAAAADANVQTENSDLTQSSHDDTAAAPHPVQTAHVEKAVEASTLH
ncbi:hypothetical protein HDU67_003987 [Dinochytrium kinnereticum]|nr:hypothetical protein HDU67_003987 [Dinochytrium kinnereticum]